MKLTGFHPEAAGTVAVAQIEGTDKIVARVPVDEAGNWAVELDDKLGRFTVRVTRPDGAFVALSYLPQTMDEALTAWARQATGEPAAEPLLPFAGPYRMSAN